jgi:hypothetical protein
MMSLVRYLRDIVNGSPQPRALAAGSALLARGGRTIATREHCPPVRALA